MDNASKACGPLVKWATAQIQYAEMLHRVEPLRQELKELEVRASESEARARGLHDTIGQLEKSISGYKAEYAELIAQVGCYFSQFCARRVL
jgi:dynein heavy chain 1